MKSHNRAHRLAAIAVAATASLLAITNARAQDASSLPTVPEPAAPLTVETIEPTAQPLLVFDESIATLQQSSQRAIKLRVATTFAIRLTPTLWADAAWLVARTIHNKRQYRINTLAAMAESQRRELVDIDTLRAGHPRLIAALDGTTTIAGSIINPARAVKAVMTWRRTVNNARAVAGFTPLAARPTGLPMPAVGEPVMQ